jgi:mRNA interferase RelE/StbE
MYKITIKKSAAKELNELPNKIAMLITSAIYQLAENPRPTGCKKLKGKKIEFWRIRIGDYRVIYTIDEEVKIIDIQKLGHRKDIYE